MSKQTETTTKRPKKFNLDTIAEDVLGLEYRMRLGDPGEDSEDYWVRKAPEGSPYLYERVITQGVNPFVKAEDDVLVLHLLRETMRDSKFWNAFNDALNDLLMPRWKGQHCVASMSAMYEVGDYAHAAWAVATNTKLQAHHGWSPKEKANASKK